jgi:hypothetical protein
MNTNSNSIKDVRFFKAGRAVFTVANPKGEHYTFRIGRSNEEQPLFVGLLTGQNNETDYTYMGIYNPEQNHVVKLTKASKYNEESTPVKVVRWAIKQVATNKELPEGYSIQHEGRCASCGRLLTEPISLQTGFGPECRKKVGIDV